MYLIYCILSHKHSVKKTKTNQPSMSLKTNCTHTNHFYKKKLWWNCGGSSQITVKFNIRNLFKKTNIRKIVGIELLQLRYKTFRKSDAKAQEARKSFHKMLTATFPSLFPAELIMSWLYSLLLLPCKSNSPTLQKSIHLSTIRFWSKHNKSWLLRSIYIQN